MLAEPLYDRQLLAEIYIQLSQKRRQLLPKPKEMRGRKEKSKREERRKRGREIGRQAMLEPGRKNKRRKE